MRVAALGAGSWGTTGASLVAPRHPTMPWARRSEVARAVHIEHTHLSHLPGFSLAPELYATGDLEEAVTSADLVTMGVPTAGFQRVLENVAGPHPAVDSRRQPDQRPREANRSCA